MDTLEFLKLVWPDTGYYMLTTNIGKEFHKHFAFDDIEDAAEFAKRSAPTQNVYFAMHAVKRPYSVDEVTGKRRYRRREDMRASRVFFLDLDVGEGKNKFPSQRDALLALAKFCSATKLPMPLAVNSGYGVHAYWPLTEEIPSEEWRQSALILHKLAKKLGFSADEHRIEDTSSLLRVVGTLNHKAAPRPVTAWAFPGGRIVTDDFLAALARAGDAAGVDWTPEAAPSLPNNTHVPYSGPTATAEQLYSACAQMRAVRDLGGDVSRNWWFQAVNTIRFVENGRAEAHAMSSGAPSYTFDETDGLLDGQERDTLSRNLGPTTCEKMQEVSDQPTLCDGCRFKDRVRAPTVAAIKPQPAVLTDDLEPEVEVTGEEVAIETPVRTGPPVEMPFPFFPAVGGGVLRKNKDDEGDEYTQILMAELYPLHRLVDPGNGTDQHSWYVRLPDEQPKEFVMDSFCIHDLKELSRTLVEQGVYFNPNHVKSVQQYMSLYIQDLQKKSKPETQYGSTGWVDDHSRFVLSDKILRLDGSPEPVFLRPGTSHMLKYKLKMGSKGSLVEQIRLMGFYNKPEYVDRQVLILASLASPLFHLTGQHGSMVHAHGEQGGSKSTALYYAMSLWGHPEKMALNGTKDGNTVTARNLYLTALNSVPLAIDEISNIDPDVLINLAFGSSQASVVKGGVRRNGTELRMGNDVEDRASLILTTSNESLHNILVRRGRVGAASSMRIFEMQFDKLGNRDKVESIIAFSELKYNYGHIGEAFLQLVLPHMSVIQRRILTIMAEIDEACGLESGERFWPAVAATIIVACEIARKAGLLPYDPALVKDWLVLKHIPAMRSLLRDQMPLPINLLSNYLETLPDNLVVMSEGNTSSVREPKGKVRGRYEPGLGRLWLTSDALRHFVDQAHIPFAAFEKDLIREKVIVSTNDRKVLTAGTGLPSARARCLVIDMKHPEMMGKLAEPMPVGRPSLRLVGTETE